MAVVKCPECLQKCETDIVPDTVQNRFGEYLLFCDYCRHDRYWILCRPYEHAKKSDHAEVKKHKFGIRKYDVPPSSNALDQSA